eukprot:2671781-Prymnesium_polylepis.1
MASGVWRALDGRTRLDAAPEQSGRHELALCLRPALPCIRRGETVIVTQGYSQQLGWGQTSGRVLGNTDATSHE